MVQVDINYLLVVHGLKRSGITGLDPFALHRQPLSSKSALLFVTS